MEPCYSTRMSQTIDALEREIERLRREVRRAHMAGDRTDASDLRKQLRRAERAWGEAVDELPDSPPGPPGERGAVPGAGRAGGTAGAPPARLLLPLREQVHQALTLLTVPAAPRLISAVHEAFFTSTIPASRLTSVRRDEERSFRTAPFARPYYLCAALTAGLLAPARGLLAVSTWPMERRVIGPLSPRVDFLTAAIEVAARIQRIRSPAPAALRLLWRFAANIPGAADGTGSVDPPAVARAALAEREIHADADSSTRQSAALRARNQLDDAQQLFGARLRAAPRAGTGA